MAQRERKTGKHQGGAPRTSQSHARIAATAKQAQALQLRIAGASYEQITQSLGYRSKATAWKAVEEALLRTIQEPANEVRAIELARLDRWLLNIQPLLQAGNLEAIDRGLKIMARLATLLGLDAPVKVAPTTPDGTTSYHPHLIPPEHFFEELLLLSQQLGSQHGNGAHVPFAADTNGLPSYDSPSAATQ